MNKDISYKLPEGWLNATYPQDVPDFNIWLACIGHAALPSGKSHLLIYVMAVPYLWFSGHSHFGASTASYAFKRNYVLNSFRSAWGWKGSK